MPVNRSHHLPLSVGLILSVLVHVGGAGVLAWAGVLRFDDMKPPTIDTVLPEVDHPPIGRDQASVARMAWIPEDQFRELIAREFSPTDQPAVQRVVDPVDQANLPHDPTPPLPQPQPPPQPPIPSRPPAREQVAVATPVATPENPPAHRGDAADSNAAAQAVLDLPDTNSDQLALANPSPKYLNVPTSDLPQPMRGHIQSNTPPQDHPPTPTPTPPNQASPAVPSRDSQPTSASKSDRESDLFGRRTEPLKIQPGHTLVGEGIEIKTAIPRFSVITRSVARPIDPRVRLVFDVNGDVILAEFIRATGYDNVDSPILNSLYQWKASGKKLAQRGRGFRIEINLVLR